LIAKVDITNSDIGFVRDGLPCEVEVDTFPKREFGFVEGEIYYVGSNVLPPEEGREFYSFPAKISLHSRKGYLSPSWHVGGREYQDQETQGRKYLS
jgi:hemolysin D